MQDFVNNRNLTPTFNVQNGKKITYYTLKNTTEETEETINNSSEYGSNGIINVENEEKKIDNYNSKNCFCCSIF